MDWNLLDLETLGRMRQQFLDGSAGRSDYWSSAADLAGYDQTFAQRIGWKWNLVLAELESLGWHKPPGEVIDWGCGTGMASRRFLASPAGAETQTLWLHDRSALAMEFAAAAVRREYPGVEVHTALPPSAQGRTLLLSHVLGELSANHKALLLEYAAPAAAVVWVEAATHDISRSLGQCRDALLGRLRAVAPCTHQDSCPMLSPANERHWCHFFAPPPPEIHTEPDWSRFAHEVGIDLRATPLSYLVLDERPAGQEPAAADGPDWHTLRIIGRNRTYKAYSLLFACGKGVSGDMRLMKRHLADAFRRARKDRLATRLVCRCQGKDIVEIRE